MIFKRMIFSGTCLCGHSYEDHHLGLVADPEAEKVIGPYIPQECEFFGCNEESSNDEHGNYHCGKYVDVEEPDPQIRAEWKGTVR